MLGVRTSMSLKQLKKALHIVTLALKAKLTTECVMVWLPGPMRVPAHSHMSMKATCTAILTCDCCILRQKLTAHPKCTQKRSNNGWTWKKTGADACSITINSLTHSSDVQESAQCWILMHSCSASTATLSWIAPTLVPLV